MPENIKATDLGENVVLLYQDKTPTVAVPNLQGGVELWLNATEIQPASLKTRVTGTDLVKPRALQVAAFTQQYRQ